MSILLDMKLCSDLKVDPAYLMDIPELKPDSAEIAYYKAIFNRIPEPDRSAIKKIYAERGELLKKYIPQEILFSNTNTNGICRTTWPAWHQWMRIWAGY